MKASLLLLVCISVVLLKHSAESKPQEISEIPDEIHEEEVTKRPPYRPLCKPKCRDSKPMALKKLKKVGGARVPNIAREIVTTARKEIRRGFFEWIADEVFNLEKLLEIVTENAKKIYSLIAEAEDKVALNKNSSSRVVMSKGENVKMFEKMVIPRCKIIGTPCKNSDECCLGFCSSSQSCALKSDR